MASWYYIKWRKHPLFLDNCPVAHEPTNIKQLNWPLCHAARAFHKDETRLLRDFQAASICLDKKEIEGIRGTQSWTNHVIQTRKLDSSRSRTFLAARTTWSIPRSRPRPKTRFFGFPRNFFFVNKRLFRSKAGLFENSVVGFFDDFCSRFFK